MGTLRKLSELQGDDPLVLTLSRGHYCPKEHQQHLELAASYPKFAVAYTQIATISTDDHHTLQEFRASVGAQWTFLSDPDRIIQKDLDIQEYTDPEHDPMIPHTLVLKPGLVIHRFITAIGFGAVRRSQICGKTCVPSPVKFGRTGISANLDSVKPGTPGISQTSTGGINAPNCERLITPGLRLQDVALSLLAALVRRRAL